MERKSAKDEKFDSIYRAYEHSVFRAAMRYAHDEHTAQDMAQQAFFQLYTHFDNVDLEYVEAWLIRTVKNLLFNHNRDSKHEMLGEVMEIIMEAAHIITHTNGMDEHYMRKEQKRRAKELSNSIFEKLYKKNAQWYDAVTLVYCLDKPQQEVADELGITIEVLHSRLYRAKQWIRKNYEKKYEKVVNWF